MFSRGQSLIEMIVAVNILLLVVSAIAFAIISSVRNADFAKNSTQASKYAQEGLERVRVIRDRDKAGEISYDTGTTILTKFSELYGVNFTCPTNCYFNFSASGVLTGTTATGFELIANFQRQILIEDAGTGQKKVSAWVEWKDASGWHKAQTTTILRSI